MAASTKRYVIYDLTNGKHVRANTAAESVAFSSVAVGGESGPEISATMDGYFDFAGRRLTNMSIYDETVKNVSGDTVVAGDVLIVSAVGATTDVVKASARSSISDATTFCIAKTGAADAGNIDAYLRVGAMISAGIPVSTSFTFASSDVNTTTNKITKTTHGMLNGCKIVFTGDVPSGLTSNTVYYVVNKSTNDFQVEATVGGGAVPLVSQGSGTMYGIRSGGGSLAATTPIYLSKISGEAITDVTGYVAGDHIVSLGTYTNSMLLFAPRFIIKL